MNHDFKTLAQFFGEENDKFVAVVKWAVYVLAGIVTFLRWEAMFVLTCLIFADTFFGLAASWSLGERIERRKFAIGMLGKIAIFVLPLVVSILGYVYVVMYDSSYNFAWVLDAAIAILIGNEALSLLSNILTILTKERVKNVDFVERMVKLMQEIITLAVDKIFSFFERKRNDNG